MEEASCLAGCDVPPAVLRDRRTMPHVTVEDVKAAGSDWSKLDSAAAPGETEWTGAVGPEGAADGELAIDLCKPAAPLGAAFKAASELGPEGVIDLLEAAGLQGRGGAGLPRRTSSGAASPARPSKSALLS